MTQRVSGAEYQLIKNLELTLFFDGVSYRCAEKCHVKSVFFYIRRCNHNDCIGLGNNLFSL